MTMHRHLLLFMLLLSGPLLAQFEQGPVMDPNFPQEYEIGGITVSGTLVTDPNAVKLFSGLQVGEKVTVPGERITRAVKNLWEQKLFSDVRIEAADIRGRTIFLHIIVVEKPRLSRYRLNNVSRNESDKLREEIELVRGQQVNEALLANTRTTISNYYRDKGYMKADVRIDQRPDTSRGAPPNSVILELDVLKGPKVRIRQVEFEGNQELSDQRLQRAMKKTKAKKWWNFLGSNKFLPKEYKSDKAKVIDTYNNEGFRNATLLKDSVWFLSEDELAIKLTLEEGGRFHYRNISFTGNTKHTTKVLQDILNIKPGDVYNKKTLESRLYMNPSGRDISSLYMDDGYLAFYPEPVEVFVEGDSIDLEIRIREGKQYRIRNIIIKGNAKTHEHVVRREIRTKPGQLFSRSDIMRTQRELSQLGYFNPETLGVNPIQDARTGTVDLEYTVEEKPSDRLELSGGWGAGRLVLSLGLSFTNFSMRKFFDGKAWQPLPSGDGQTLNLRAQTNGRFFQSYSISFVEPWLGGRKANSLSVSAYHSVQTNGQSKYLDTPTGQIPNPTRSALLIYGASVGLGKRIAWPDDYFILRNTIGYQHYNLQNFSGSGGQIFFSFNTGSSNVLSYTFQLSRNSVDQPFFARSGSDMTFTFKATPPWSVFNPDRDWANLPDQNKYKWVEFHKWKFTTVWYNKLTNSKSGHNLVLMTRAGFGFLGSYNPELGDPPFERFYLGGVPITGFVLDGREIVSMRGYDDFSLSPQTGNFVINKYTTELRFPVSLNPQATIYTLGFFEASNTWGDLADFDPFKLYRSAGFGLRLFLPMFGPMGLDYGWRLDDVPGRPGMAKSQFHFSIGIDFGEL